VGAGRRPTEPGRQRKPGRASRFREHLCFVLPVYVAALPYALVLAFLEQRPESLAAGVKHAFSLLGVVFVCHVAFTVILHRRRRRRARADDASTFSWWAVVFMLAFGCVVAAMRAAYVLLWRSAQ